MKLAFKGYLKHGIIRLISISYLSSHDGKLEVPEQFNDDHIRNAVIEPDKKVEVLCWAEIPGG